MWLRDSAAQLRPYLILCPDDPALQDVLIGVLHRQLEYIAIDPYANAFNRSADGAGHTNDETEMGPWVWERKYEIDSLCYPIELAYRLWRITGRDDVIDEGHRFDDRVVVRGEPFAPRCLRGDRPDPATIDWNGSLPRIEPPSRPVT